VRDLPQAVFQFELLAWSSASFSEMDELQRMEDLLASRAIDKLPVELMENLLVKELVASIEAIIPYFKAAPARSSWLQLRQVLSSALRLQAHARSACTQRSIGVAIKQRALLKQSAAGAMTDDVFLKRSAACTQVPAGDSVQRKLTYDAPSETVQDPAAAQCANAAAAVPDFGRGKKLMGTQAASSSARAGSGSRTSGIGGAADFRRQTLANSQSPKKLSAANNGAYEIPSGNRHLARFAPAMSPRAHTAPALTVQQLQSSPTAAMMQRVRAARTNMPVYSPPPLSPTTNGCGVSDSLTSTVAISLPPLLSKAAVPQKLVQSNEQLSPSVLWVDASGMHTPSAGAASSEAALTRITDSALVPALAELQEPQHIVSSWPQLKDKLEASLLAHERSPSQANAERGPHVVASHSTLEKEIALMQV
jgi:hypothetical protein